MEEVKKIKLNKGIMEILILKTTPTTLVFLTKGKHRVCRDRTNLYFAILFGLFDTFL
jgi:hypothetical protein